METKTKLIQEIDKPLKHMEHVESSDCWCEPTLIQSIDDEHDCQVWLHKGHEELEQ